MTDLKTIDQAALAICSREPIHIPGAIQPHGVLMVLREPDLVCIQASTNSASVTGLGPAQLLGREVQDIFRADAGKVAAACREENPSQVSPVSVTLQGQHYHCVIHRHDGVLIVEVEHAAAENPSLYRRMQQAFADLRHAESPTTLHQTMAEFIAKLSGFERVMVYRFDTDWHGEVVGECLTADVDAYMGHHFPASDIPEQARALYRRNWLRIIPDATYKATPLEPPLNPQTGRPLDLSFSVLRSVSPVHLEYLRNMDVAASMSISLIVDDRLWGLIACHHRTPLQLPHAIRSACEMYGQVASLELGAKEEKERLTLHYRATRIQTRFFDIIAEEQNFVEALVKFSPQLLTFMNAGGAAIHVNGKLTLLGNTPNEAAVKGLVEWLKQQPFDSVIATDELSSVYPEGSTFQDCASGLLAVKLSRVEPQYVLWFRPEVITTVTWAGNPHKPTTDHLALHPRKSFATWKQKVTGRSLPWTSAETHGAEELRTALNALLLRRTEKLSKLNAELEKKNTDLNSFAYIASHDLREPLRGMANYARFIQEDHAGSLQDDALARLSKITDLAVYCEELLDELNHFSKVGRMEIRRKPTRLDAVVSECSEALSSLLHESGAELKRPHPLPEVSCDPVLIREVFSNLITNAIRYNTSHHKWVEVGVRPPIAPEEPLTLYVQDNGIGIREKHREAVFQIFRRLHPDNRYGKGTGAGLAIVRSIVEKHGGRIWIEAPPEGGTTFLFTLPTAS
ncbi:light-regulated signal transduction histidine kinase (bacteriophytochrome) [Roseimicrobium gellanilyticum]|uniref:histidine kinase n=1 Tax=Roseimicrobium gellanilyticum TaxID=748857 RepID=A0A366HH68_9BACT|nr:ATP-binding protein [Roseimicrobium gellanilyticum]RBP41410.1 light-regulated signal transduction histidine kinase (bacteriophytochrome) [Roseimicrobium gellanilyticum]